MSYNTYELSAYNGAPVELFLFRDDVSLNNWAFSTGEDALIDGSITYLPDVIARTSIKQSDNTGGIEIKVVASSPLAQEFKAYLPARPISIVLKRYHRTDVATEMVTLFTGQVTTVAFDTDGFATLNCEPITKSVQRKVPWQVYKANCNWALYEQGCGVLRELFAMPAGAYTISGTTVTSLEFSAKPDGWFTNGYLEATDTKQRRFIVKHVGSVLTLDYPFSSLEVATPLTAYAGCDRTRGTCRTKFNNLPNQLAFDWIPGENPYTTTFGPNGAGQVPGVTIGQVFVPFKAG